MMLKKTIFIILFFEVFQLSAQKPWNLYAGISYTNVLDKLNDAQVVYYRNKNAPNYLVNFHLGINKQLIHSKRLNFLIGLGIYGAGAKDGPFILSQDNVNNTNRFYYLKMPFTLEYRILKSKDFFLKASLLPSNLLFRVEACNDDGYCRLGFGTYGFYQLDYNIGLGFPIYKKLSGSVDFTRDFISNNLGSIQDIEGLFEKHIHIAFNSTLYYRL